MKRSFSILLFLCSCYVSLCQDQGWQQVRIDSFLSVSLPGNFTSYDTVFVKKGRRFNTRVFKASTVFSDLAILVMQTDLKFNPYDLGSMEEAYDGVKHGVTRTAESQGFSIEMKDTIVNNVRGFKANFFTDNSRLALSRINYGFCVNTLIYTITTVSVKNNGIKCNEDMKSLLRSIRFNKEEILKSVPINSESYSAFEKGEKLGELLAPILLVAGIVIFFVYKSKTRR